MSLTAIADLYDTAAPSPADRLATLCAREMQGVNALILDRMASQVELIPELADHLISAGGKRLRPLLTIAVAKMLGYAGDAAPRLAAAVEFIHTATLLHDDVVDGSQLRRGKRSANLIWGNAPTVLVGDFLFARAFSLMVETGSLQVLGILSRASSIIAEGEVRQLEAAHDVDASVANYLEIIEAKTAELFAAAAHVAGVAAGVSKDEEKALDTYGRHLGLAFQLVDDVLDYGGREAALGKSPGDDFREGKVTMPVAFALAGANKAERAFWVRCIGGKREAADFASAVQLISKHDALQQTLAQARGYADTAKAALMRFPKNECRDRLIDLADFVVERAC